MRFSLFSILEFDAAGSRTLASCYEDLLEQIVEAEHLGFTAYWIGEHHGYLIPHQALACPNPALILAAAAQRTHSIGLNTAVANLVLRHPLLLAEDYAMVDLLSRGRLGLGIGRGSYPHEYPAFGQTREESQARFSESWDIIQQAWRGATITFQGHYYQIDGFRLNVLPVQKPLPRYWYSVMREESFVALGRAAQPIIAMSHLSAQDWPTLAKLAQIYRQEFLAAGGADDQYELPLVFFTCVAPTRSEAQQQGRAALSHFLLHQHQGVDPGHLSHKVRQLEERHLAWFGSPTDLVEWLEETRQSLQNRHIVFWLDFGGMPHASVLRSMQLLAREVMPHFG